ncbi:MAG TPA: glycoside hydrolase family 44 protein [Candidatus Sulfotelmatobacter sp.]|nr:glycoside hydrolase family 44 protein [Candidatus Sulfotelmatobacter sp.]
MQKRWFLFLGAGRYVSVLAMVFLFPLALRADQIIYDDALENGWQNWGWAEINYANTSPVHSGSDSISVTIATNWSGIQIWHSDQDSTPYASINFWLNGGTSGGQRLQVYGLLDENGSQNYATSPRYALSPLPANGWQLYSVPLSQLDVADEPNFTGFVIQDALGETQPTFYVDDISLVSATNTASNGTNAMVTVQINTLANRHAISPQIYGVAFATSNQLADLNFTMNRMGGNNETRDNWEINAHNLDADWYFESYPDSASTTPGNTVDAFVANSKESSAQPLITISMIGWMPYLGSGRAILYSYSTNKYGPQKSTDPYLPAAGDGLSSTNNNQPITWNNPDDANFPTNANFEQGLVQHLMQQWGASTNGGVGYYIMDNEHSIWFQTHQDIHPVGPTMQEIWGDMRTYASMVKSNDPNALVLGPEEWGWSGYLYSGYDQQWAGQHGDYNPNDYPDRTANGDWYYCPWLLHQFQLYQNTNQQRLLDYFTVHCYPQENNVNGNAVDPTTELLRNQSTRIFWDSNYVDPSWINSVIALIPLMKTWVATNYPGTKIGITEYNWGAEPYMNGATAQADILGIFGSQGLDLATRWETPTNTSPTYLAMKMYRNYDGNKSTFGDTSVQTTVPDPDDLDAFAAVRSSDGALTVMVINKDITNATPVTLSISNLTITSAAQVWQLAGGSLSQLASVQVTNGILSQVLPSQSVTLFVVPSVPPFQLQASAGHPAGRLLLWLYSQQGSSYMLQSSSNLTTWQDVSTNLLSSNSISFLIPITNSASMFYRAAFMGP